MFFFFFFQAEDGIRDWSVTGVQTCALPISLPIVAWGTEEQKTRFVPPLARGESLGAFALTEPDSGSDASALRTRAEADVDGWRVSGRKQWITNGAAGGTILLFART